MKPSLLHFIIILFASLSSISLAQNKVTDRLNNEKLNTIPLDQHLFVHLNRTIFSELDTLWFKGYTVQGPLQQASNISQTMIIALIDKDSTIVSSYQYLLYQGTAEGQIVMPKNIKSGYYQLVAYTSNMLNFDPQHFFRTNIKITNTKLRKYNFSFGFNKNTYQNTDTVEIKLRAYDKNKENYDNLPLNYTIVNGELGKNKTKFKTDKQGNATLQFPYSYSKNKTNTPTKVEINGGDYMAPISEEVYIPAKANAIDVQLLPEGGLLVADLLQTIAFKFRTSH